MRIRLFDLRGFRLDYAERKLFFRQKVREESGNVGQVAKMSIGQQSVRQHFVKTENGKSRISALLRFGAVVVHLNSRNVVRGKLNLCLMFKSHHASNFGFDSLHCRTQFFIKGAELICWNYNLRTFLVMPFR